MEHIRFDFGSIGKPHRTDDGVLLAEATFARDGVLEYRKSDGSTQKELRLPETNKDSATLTSFGLATLTTEHPPVLINKDNAKDYRSGITLQNVRYETTHGKGGFVRGQVAVMDSDAIALIESREKIELSAGYTCDLEEVSGVWKGQHYDAIQRNVKVNHVALTRRGRAGADVRLHLDSFSGDVAVQLEKADSNLSTTTKKRRMATVNLDGVGYEDVPEVFASVAAPKLKQLESLQPKYDSAVEELGSLREQLKESEYEKDSQAGRADAHEICLTNAEALLEEIGYHRDGKGGYVHADGKGKMPPWLTKKVEGSAEEEADETDKEEVDEDDEEKMPMKAKAKSKAKKKMDSEEETSEEEVRIDPRVAAKQLMTAWREADGLIEDYEDGESFSDRNFDSVETAQDVRRLVVAVYNPEVATRVDSLPDGYIDGMYDAILASNKDSEEDETPRNDSAGNLLDMVSAARSGSRSKSATTASESAQRRMIAHKKPLTLSKERH